jgi:tetratricopeptide (TPR) repeat protein
MGLLDDAVGEFQVAARAPSKAPDAYYLIGLVRLDQGRVDEALSALDAAVSAPQASQPQQAAAEYQRGIILADHRSDGVRGLQALKRSRTLGGNAPDLERRIQSLAKTVGDGDGRPKSVDYV